MQIYREDVYDAASLKPADIQGEILTYPTGPWTRQSGFDEFFGKIIGAGGVYSLG